MYVYHQRFCIISSIRSITRKNSNTTNDTIITRTLFLIVCGLTFKKSGVFIENDEYFVFFIFFLPSERTF
jgi:hypothetical protein